ncbi:MAG: hypothetical protein IPJ52_00095 [Rhodocyclaceae bacterium]|jgi:hypothetical protein|nr:hypothetical protein [Rhodocyclaceae bacterium]MBK6555389.1 hypothetical protein [Rhodocyclaceae bacterium]MBK6676703.1 hypothetical protein [Rhodocyclaceae bacterium]MBK7812804.1 hypothetical protein [Rhodocyclaceae bacterium]MBK9309328.1 hypothetical protein [Rhodocyclaceae bacterium]
MTIIPREPSYLAPLAEWVAYRRAVAAFPVGEPGRELTLRIADDMIADLQREEAEAGLPAAA